MSNGLPYNNDLAKHMENMPLPNIDMAWADMKKRLEEEKKDRKPFFLFWLNGCLLWAFLGVLIIGLGLWFYLSKDTTIAKNENQKNEPNKANINKIKDTLNSINNTTNLNTENVVNNNTKTVKENNTETIYTNTENTKVTKEKATEINSISETKPNSNKDNYRSLNNKRLKSHKEKAKNNYAVVAFDKPLSKRSPKKNYNKKPKNNPNNELVKNDNEANETTEPEKELKENEITKEALANKKNEESIKLKNERPKEPITETPKTNEAPKANNDIPKAKSRMLYSGGIGINQLLPINGEELTPYNSQGRKGTLLDYIPSLYFKAEKEKKWFLQLEGRYGAPQYNKKFLYNQIAVPIFDTSGNAIFTRITSMRLKKSFYHQAFLSFNYYVLPKWSLGVGLQWNKFAGAFVEKQVNRKNTVTLRDSILVNSSFLDNEDSTNSFKKNYGVAFFETRYEWKNFTIGLKYSRGLTPYVNLVLPNGVNQKVQNSSTAIFLNYKLWRGRKNKKKAN